MASQSLMQRPTLYDMFTNLGKRFGQQRLLGLLSHSVQRFIQRQACTQQGRHLAGRSSKCAGGQLAGHAEPERKPAGPLRTGFAQIGQVDALGAQLLSHRLAARTVNRPIFFVSLVIET